MIDKEGVIVVGHTRYVAASELGYDKVPVFVTHLDETACRAYRLMDNRSHEDSYWDTELLSLEVIDLSKLDFDLSLTGFDQKEIEKFLEQPFPEVKEFEELDESLADDVETIECPNCGHRFQQ